MAEVSLSAVIGLFGVMLGAMLHAWFTRKHEQQRFYRENQRQAYSLFLSALAGLAAFPPGSPSLIEARKGMIEARCQIALFGSPKAIRQLAEIFEKYENFESILAQTHLSALISTMRDDSGGDYERGLGVEVASLIVSTVGAEKSS